MKLDFRPSGLRHQFYEQRPYLIIRAVKSRRSESRHQRSLVTSTQSQSRPRDETGPLTFRPWTQARRAPILSPLPLSLMISRLPQLLWFLAFLIIGSYGLTLSWILLAAGAACVGLAGLSSAAVGLRERRCWSWLDGAVCLAAGYMVVRAALSPVWDLAKEDVLLLGMGLTVFWAFRSRKLAAVGLLAIAGFTLVNAGYFYLQQAGGDPWVPMDSVSDSAMVSPDFGLYQDYGSLGNAMAVSGMLLLSFGLWAPRRRVWLRSLVLLLALAALVVALLSGSRSAILSIAVSGLLLAVLCWLYVPNLAKSVQLKVRLGLVLVGLAGCALVGLLGYQTFNERAGQSNTAQSESLTNIRTDYWGMAVEQALGSPLVGTGARSYSYECFKHWESNLNTIEANPEFAHNEYLQLWADYGLIGLLLVTGVLIAYWGRAFYGLFMRVEGGSSERTWMQVAGLVGLTVVMVHSISDFPLRIPWNLCLAALCLAWCAGRSEDGEKVGSALPTPNPLSPIRRTLFFFRSPLSLLLAISVGCYGAKELWAGLPLLQLKQSAEGGAWSPEGKAEMLGAYQLANRRSPDFRRSLRLGILQHVDYLANGESLKQAEAAYQQSISRHPFNPVSQVGLANLYSQSGQLELAHQQYLQTKSYAVARGWWLEFYFNWARNTFGRAAQAVKDGDAEQADALYAEAALLAAKGTSRSKPRQELRRASYVARVVLAIREANYQRSEALWKEAREKVKPWILSSPKGKAHRQIAEEYLQAAVEEWSARKPALAKTLFERAHLFFRQDRQVNKGKHEAERLEKLQYIERTLKLLKAGGF